jgi:23S rRNA pseudouridine1911/1915/1917 synthase
MVRMVSMDAQVLNFVFTGESGRLDKFLVQCLPDLSRSRLQGLIKDERVKVNGAVVTKAGFDLEAADQVEITLPPTQPTDIVPENIPLNVIFESDDLVVIDKPAGMVVHPAAGHAQGTLVNAILGHDPDLEGVGGEQRPGIVHRLDKDTSGLILVAKNDKSLQWLQDQFRLRKVRKYYLALSDGHPPTPTGRIEAAIGRDPSLRKQMAIVPDAKGRASVSEYRVLESFPAHTLFEVHPETGRTHQIRLHLAFLGCPIVGDSLYGNRHISIPIARQFLHAARLSIVLPGESQPRTFESPLPEDLQTVLDELRSRS